MELAVLAGSLSTMVFVTSILPMLVKAYRSKDLSSYSPGYIILTNIGNLIHSLYIFSLPLGPLWLLHAFYTLSSALMLLWYLRFEWRPHTLEHPST
jgi:uncharacterized protein with PQ loop repeat